jgi:YHS domain-containing protein
MKWIFYFGILLALLMFVRGVLRALLAPMRTPSNFENPGPSRTRGSTVKQGTMEKDPVCGTYVDTSSALQGSFRGETKYFCSSECLEKFKQSR